MVQSKMLPGVWVYSRKNLAAIDQSLFPNPILIQPGPMDHAPVQLNMEDL